jgi:2-haloacid dehalogenase
LRIAALSNWSAEKFPIARSRYPFLEWFETIVISGEVGMVKPNPRIYEHLLAQTGFEPRTTVFIDDSKDNVAAAAELGMTAIEYRGPAELRVRLHGLGVLDSRSRRIVT